MMGGISVHFIFSYLCCICSVFFFLAKVFYGDSGYTI
jgi:hypothetical protein